MIPAIGTIRRRRSGRPTGVALAATGLAIGLTVVIALAVAWTTPSSTSAPALAAGSSGPTVSAPDAGSPLPTAAPPVVDCRRDAATPPAPLAGDPCPSAITAVELAVATVRLPIDRMVIEPGPLFCNIVWEGVDSPPACYAPIVIPGQYMHAYVSFQGSSRVAVVMLGLDLPANLDASAASRPPWHTTLVTVAVPPPGWVMP